MPNTIKLHRVIPAPVEKVFRAFTDPDALARWLPPYGFTGKVHEMDTRIGGSFKMSFTNFTTKSTQPFGGKYLDIKPGQLLKYSDKFDDPNLPGEMINTITFREVIGGTELNVTQEGVPDVIPPEMCYLGWQDSLEQLIKLVTPNIPDA